MRKLVTRLAICALAAFAVGVSGTLLAKDSGSIEIKPSKLKLKIGETAQLKAVVKDGDGKVVPNAQVLFFGDRLNLDVTPSGFVKAVRSGVHTVKVLSPSRPFEGEPDTYTRNFEPGIRGEVDVTVPVPPLTRISIEGLPATVYEGTTIPVRIQGVDKSGATRNDIAPKLRVRGKRVAETDGFGNLTGLKAGQATLIATAEKVKAKFRFTVVPNPVRTIKLKASTKKAKTGDVIHFEAIAKDERGRVVDDVPVSFLLKARPDQSYPESRGNGASAMVLDDGRFVAEQQGLYTVVAMSGDAVAHESVRITRRDVSRKFEFVGQARVSEHRTSDLWVWEGVDGRDYAIIGGWNAGGKAYIYDVTDPANMELVDTVQVDARTVNDVKISEDGRIAIISREGASNRRNGIVIFDVSDPRNAKKLSVFDDQLTGGVHNLFIYRDYVYVVNNGRRWDVINIENPAKPYRVSRFETDSPARSVHDVWVRDGILYQAGRTDSVILVDVGGGGKGGTPARPVEMQRIEQITDWSHAVWPFKSKSADRFYVVAGDETFYPNPRLPKNQPFTSDKKLPLRAGGWIHFIEFDESDKPHEIARYEVGDFGVHNYWIDWEQELLYVAYYQGGLRVLDISGELLGDLFAQGREVGRFYSDDPQGHIPNSPMAWGPQPHKGTIFFTDFHSGLWAVRMVSEDD